MTDLLTAMATPAWVYLLIFGFLTVDAVFPVMPIQAIMITAGALTVYGNLNLPLAITIGAVAMFTGDSIGFVLGRTAGHAGGHRATGRLVALRERSGSRTDADQPSRTLRAAERFTRGLRRPGPLVILLCRFVPGGRMASGYHAGRTGYPIKLWFLYDGFAAIAWASYGGLVGHLGGTAVTQSAWRLFAIAATAAIVFGTAGWILALFGGRDALREDTAAGLQPALEAAGAGAGGADLTTARAASVAAPPPRSSPTATGRS